MAKTLALENVLVVLSCMGKNEALVFLASWDGLGEKGRMEGTRRSGCFLGRAGPSYSTHTEAFVDSRVEMNYQASP